MQNAILIVVFFMFSAINTWAVTPEKFAEAIASVKLVSGFQAMEFGFRKVPSLPGPYHTKIQVVYSDKGMKYELQYDSSVENSPELIIKDLSVLKALAGLCTFPAGVPVPEGLHPEQMAVDLFTGVGRNPTSWAELESNAEKSDPIATARIKKTAAVAFLFNSTDLLSQLETVLGPLSQGQNFLQKTQSTLEAESSSAIAAAKKYQSKMNETYKKWSETETARANYEAMDQKLEYFVLRNDRKMVAEILTAYIPWTLMSPSEITAWKLWIEAIRNPNPAKTVLAFRGVQYDTDKVQRLELPNGEQRLGFFSTMLTKNQGSYTRRLRSWISTRSKNADLGKGIDGLFSGKISDEFRAHASEPVGSKFISLTTDYDTAFRFAGGTVTSYKAGKRQIRVEGGMLALKIDARRAIPNFGSALGFEKEILVPLIIFPDEIVHYQEGIGQASTNLTAESIKADRNNFLQAVAQKTGVNPSALSFDVKVGYKFLMDVTTAAGTSTAMTCGGMF